MNLKKKFMNFSEKVHEFEICSSILKKKVQRFKKVINFEKTSRISKKITNFEKKVCGFEKVYKICIKNQEFDKFHEFEENLRICKKVNAFKKELKKEQEKIKNRPANRENRFWKLQPFLKFKRKKGKWAAQHGGGCAPVCE